MPRPPARWWAPWPVPHAYPVVIWLFKSQITIDVQCSIFLPHYCRGNTPSPLASVHAGPALLGRPVVPAGAADGNVSQPGPVSPAVPADPQEGRRQGAGRPLPSPGRTGHSPAACPLGSISVPQDQGCWQVLETISPLPWALCVPAAPGLASGWVLWLFCILGSPI